MSIATEGYSPAKIAQKIGVGVTTIKTWSKELNVLPQKNSSGRNFFSDDHIQIFQAIKELRDENKGFETIKRMIKIPEPLDSEIDSLPEQEIQLVESPSIPTPIEYNPLSLELIKQEIRKVLNEEAELAERYAKATYTIGKLEERIKHQEGQLKRLPSVQEVQDQHKIKQLDKTEELSTRPWWKRNIIIQFR